MYKCNLVVMLNHTGRRYSSQKSGHASTANFSDMLDPTSIPTPDTIQSLGVKSEHLQNYFLKCSLTTPGEGVDSSSPFPSRHTCSVGSRDYLTSPFPLPPHPSCCPINSKKKEPKLCHRAILLIPALVVFGSSCRQ